VTRCSRVWSLPLLAPLAALRGTPLFEPIQRIALGRCAVQRDRPPIDRKPCGGPSFLRDARPIGLCRNWHSRHTARDHYYSYESRGLRDNKPSLKKELPLAARGTDMKRRIAVIWLLGMLSLAVAIATLFWRSQSGSPHSGLQLADDEADGLVVFVLIFTACGWSVAMGCVLFVRVLFERYKLWTVGSAEPRVSAQTASRAAAPGGLRPK
jgi:hypothetical protein